MNEALLKSLMRLFALIENIHGELDHAYTRNYIELLLNKDYNTDIATKYTAIYDNFYNTYLSFVPLLKAKPEKIYDELTKTTQQINIELPPKKRFLLIINILQLVKFFKSSHSQFPLSESISKTIGKIANMFYIPVTNYLNAEAFILDSLHRMPNKQYLLIISHAELSLPDVKIIHRDNLDGQLYFLYDENVNLYLFFYKGISEIELNNKPINAKQLYIFNNSASITGPGLNTIYYNDVVRRYLYSKLKNKITYTANSISYQYKKSANGIKPFSFTAYSGQLIGIIGGSGVGKSTLMNLLNGNLEPQKGAITINGYNLYKERNQLNDILGYVPQNDLLIESLTVYENLYYNAKLSYGDLSDSEIAEKVLMLLSELDLYDIRELKVGTPLDKIISGGERKRLNIALELIREPSIFFLDEPTSGLSSSDAENIMHIIQEFTLKGKLVVVNIHQPSSTIFRLFDQLIIIDKGGYPVYVGNTMDALRYFKKQASRVDIDSIECRTCNNLYPEVLFQILEEKEINDLGESKSRRKNTPQEWYELFKLENENQLQEIIKEPLPIIKIKSANKWKQFLIQGKRNLLSKLADNQYVLLSLLITPILAAILGFACKYFTEDQNGGLTYIFRKNENIPSYLFMSVIVALFVGMIMSAEELFHDRGLRKRERYHNLSAFSYINAKLALLIALSAFQSLIYILIGNSILEIQEMNIAFWMILFSVFVFANLLGLNISAGLKSIVSIYIMVPMMMVPQILLAGVIVKFDKMHPFITSAQKVPMIGEVMVTRWAFEAMMVHQYKDNAFQKYYFDTEQRESELTYLSYYFIPELQSQLRLWYNNDDSKKSLVFNSFLNYQEITGRKYSHTLTFDSFDKTQYNAIHSYLTANTILLKANKKDIINEKDKLYNSIMRTFADEQSYKEFRNNHYNDKVADYVLNKAELQRIKIEKDNLVSLYEPIYQYPISKFGRAHFYSPVKNIGGLYLNTLWFNILTIWIMSGFLYVLLYTNGLSVMMRFFRRKQSIH